MNICKTCKQLVGGPYECDCEECDCCGGWHKKGEYMIDLDLNLLLCVSCAEDIVERIKKNG